MVFTVSLAQVMSESLFLEAEYRINRQLKSSTNPVHNIKLPRNSRQLQLSPTSPRDPKINPPHPHTPEATSLVRWRRRPGIPAQVFSQLWQ
jgi:hypothetical protein